MQLNTNTIMEWCNTVHAHNLRSIQKAIADGNWHWLLPESWEINDTNKVLIYKLADVVLSMRKSPKLGDTL